jgi:hypothetical protein
VVQRRHLLTTFQGTNHPKGKGVFGVAVSVLDGEAVRAELKNLGVSQAQLSRFIRMPKSDLTRALNGHRMAPESTYRIALGLDQLRRGHRAE